MNILKVQDTLKNLSDEQLAQEMRLPSGTAPQYLVMTEMQRRQKMRAEFSGQEPPKTTMAEEMSGEVPPEPPAPPEGGQPPDGGQAEVAPQDANAQGLMGLPDQTMAGGAMRARISGQPQQVDGMTAMPPQGMAAGGAVQFGSPLSNAPQQGAVQSQGYAPVQQYNPTPYTPPKDDYSNIRHQFDGIFATKKGAPNPRVHMSEAERYGLPAGMAAPTYGTPGLNRTITGKDGQRTRYSWENDAARDAYIRYMTPPAKAATAAPAAGATAPVTKAGGGPIRMGGGKDVPTVGGPETSAFEDWWNSIGFKPEQVRAIPAPERERYIENLRKNGRVTGVNSAGNPNYEQEVQSFLDKEVQRARAEIAAGKNSPPFFGSLFTPRGEVERRAAERDAALKERDRLTGDLPSLDAPLSVPPPLSGRDVPGAVEALAQYSPPQQTLTPTPDNAGEGANAPDTPIGLTPMTTDYASLNIPTERRPTPPSAAISGLPAMPNLRPSGGGIASLPKPEKDNSYEDYMKQANALLAEAGGDPAADKDRSFNNALMKLGLGMAASKNQSLLGAVAEGGLPALEQYTADEAQRRKDARAMAGDKLAVLGAGTQMRQTAEKDYRDQLYKAEDLRQKGRESEARILEAEATARFRMAELGIREAELGSAREERDLTRAYQDRVLQATIDNNRATLEKDPDAVRTLKAQYGDKWQVALKAQNYQDDLEEYTASYKAAMANNSLEDAKYFKEKMDAAITSLEQARKDLYGSGDTGMSATPTKPPPKGDIVQ